MTGEEKIVETEKSREKYFYIDKEKTYQVLTGIATSFIGASLALIVFTALHKPTVPPCPMFGPKPCPMKMYEPFRGQPPMMLPPKQDFRHYRGGFRFHRPFRGHGELRGKDFKKDKFFHHRGKKFNTETPISPKDLPSEAPKK